MARPQTSGKSKWLGGLRRGGHLVASPQALWLFVIRWLFVIALAAIALFFDSPWMRLAVGLIGLAVASGFLLCTIRRSWDYNSKKYVFWGLLPFLATSMVFLVAWLADKPPMVAPGAPRNLAVVIEDSDVVCYARGQGVRVGGDVFDRNGLAYAERVICRHLDKVLGLSSTARPTPWEFVALLLNWETAPPMAKASSGPGKIELFTIAGDGMVPAVASASLEEMLVTHLANRPPSSSRPPGLRGLKEFVSDNPETFVVLIATGDMDSESQARTWRDFQQARNLGCILLPSVPRSGQVELRGHRAKADIVRTTTPPAKASILAAAAATPALTWLAEPTEFRPGELYVPFFSSFKDAAAPDEPASGFKSWDRARDLDALRGKLFGEQQIDEIDQAVANGHLEQLQMILPAGWSNQNSPDVAARVVLTLSFFLWATCVGLGACGKHQVACRVFNLQNNIQPFSWQTRAACLACGLCGLLLVALGIWVIWPIYAWRLVLPPALAVWAYLLTLSVLLLKPLAKNLNRESRPLEMFLTWYVAVAALLPPLVGMWARGSGMLWLNCLALAPMLGMFATCLFPAKPGGANDESNNRQAWAGPVRWTPVAIGASIWMAMLMLGFEPPADSGLLREVVLHRMLVVPLVLCFLCPEKSSK